MSYFGIKSIYNNNNNKNNNNNNNNDNKNNNNNKHIQHVINLKMTFPPTSVRFNLS